MSHHLLRRNSYIPAKCFLFLLLAALLTMPALAQSNTCGGGALHLNAGSLNGQNVTIGNIPALQEFTFEAWIKSDAINFDLQAIVEPWWETTFTHFQTGGGGNSVVYTANGGINMPTVQPSTTWRHVALTTRSGLTMILVDGVLYGYSAANAYASILAASDVRIGAGWGGRFFRGQIDEVRFWHKALTASEVQAWKDKDVTSDHPHYAHLHAYWKFDHASGSVLHDQRGNRHGTVVTSVANVQGSATTLENPSWVTSTAPIACPPNSAPEAEDDLFATDEDQAANGNVLLNDSDANGDALVAALVAGATNGTVTLNADGSFTYIPAANFFGVDEFTYVAGDGTDTSAPARVIIEVRSVNDLPVADAGDDQAFTCALNAGLEVTLDGSGSSDLESPLSYSWSSGSIELGGSNPSVVLVPGTYLFTLTVTDTDGGEATDEVSITIGADADAPVVSLNSLSTTLWPPNNKMHTIQVADLVSGVVDACQGTLDASAVKIASVSSDEAIVTRGKGKSAEIDVVIGSSCTSVDVRAQRDGSGNGRVYSIVLAAADANGNVGEATFSVEIPHDDSGRPAVNDGAAAEVVSACSAGANAAIAGLAGAEQNVLSGASMMAADAMPTQFELSDNYPNPFNPSTTIRFGLPETAHVRLAVYDVLGRAVKTLVDGTYEAGYHEAIFEASGLPSGTYVYRLDSGAQSITKSLVLMK